MLTTTSRRGFLKNTAAGAALATFGDVAFLGQLRPVSAAETKLDPKIVRLDSEIEPVVQMIEETPRDKLLETVAAKIHGGLSYREVLAGLLLAGVRNVAPRPSVGFKFHAVLVVNSAHLASLSSPDEHRWLPIFWALDHFKTAQAQDVREVNWTMGPVDESAVPKPTKARAALAAALDNWDEAAADAAVAGLVRSASPTQAFELLFRYGARDFRDIGHKAIYVANSCRTLQCIGWRHAEPVLRSLVYALQKHEAQANPAKADLPADRPWKRNLELAKKIRDDWQDGKLDDAATLDMLAALRTGSAEDACAKAVEIINRGIAPQAIWDALLLCSGECLARQPGIVGLHTVTSTNALRYAYEASGNDETRRMMLLQNAAFLPLFRAEMQRRGGVGDLRIDKLAPSEAKESDAGKQVEAIFHNVGGDKLAAAQGVLAYRKSGGDPKALIDAARLLTFIKGNDAHDYKFSSAVLEDYYNVSSSWRDRFLASSVYWLRGSGQKDNALVQRTRAALKT